MRAQRRAVTSTLYVMRSARSITWRASILIPWLFIVMLISFIIVVLVIDDTWQDQSQLAVQHTCFIIDMSTYIILKLYLCCCVWLSKVESFYSVSIHEPFTRAHNRLVKQNETKNIIGNQKGEGLVKLDMIKTVFKSILLCCCIWSRFC